MLIIQTGIKRLYAIYKVTIIYLDYVYAYKKFRIPRQFFPSIIWLLLLEVRTWRRTWLSGLDSDLRFGDIHRVGMLLEIL